MPAEVGRTNRRCWFEESERALIQIFSIPDNLLSRISTKNGHHTLAAAVAFI
jgi:hypothetical protein